MSHSCSSDPEAPAGTPDVLRHTAERAVRDTVAAMKAAAKPQPCAEGELIERVLAGENEAFYELVRPHERALYTAAWGILRNEGDAEDVAQDAVLKAFLNLKQFRRESSFKTWVVQIVINEALARRRRDSRRGEESLDSPGDDDGPEYIPRDVADWREIPSEALARRELRAALQAALMRLDEKYRAVLILRDIEGFSIEETSRILGVSQANVKVRLLRARLQMRDQLAPGFDGSWTTGEPYRKVRSW